MIVWALRSTSLHLRFVKRKSRFVSIDLAKLCEMVTVGFAGARRANWSYVFWIVSTNENDCEKRARQTRRGIDL